MRASAGMTASSHAWRGRQRSIRAPPVAARRLALYQTYIRHYAAADSAIDRALALAPSNPRMVRMKVMVALARGDRDSSPGGDSRRRHAGRFHGAVRRSLPSFRISTGFSTSAAAPRSRLPPSAFDDDRANWGIVRTELYHLRGDRSRTAIYADSARLAFEEQRRATPDDPQLHSFIGLAQAYLGHKDDAIREGQRGVELMPISKDVLRRLLPLQLARIYILLRSRTRRSTSSSRCSGSPSTSHPAGSGSIPPSTAAEQPAVQEAGGGHGVTRRSHSPQ